MSTFKNISRFEWLDQLIRQEKTGNPPALARRIGVSVRQLYYLIDELRDLGLPVDYCRTRKTFYYRSRCRLVFILKVEHVSGKELLGSGAR